MKAQPRLSARTRLIGIFGDPVEHSRSPAMHNAAFAALGLDYRYVAFRIDAINLKQATHSIRALGLRGVNVTVPHKETIRRYLDTTSDLAKTVGAVNTVVNDNGRLHGENTDVFGFVQSLRKRRIRLKGRNAIVIGAGGTSRAVLCGLRELGVAQVVLVNRTNARAKKLVHDLRRHVPACQILGLDALNEPPTFENVNLVVNATSLGWGNEKFPDIAVRSSKAQCLFYDMAYGRRTDFLKRAKKDQRPYTDGGSMLVLQAARSFTLWTQRRAPIAEMRKAFCNNY